MKKMVDPPLLTQKLWRTLSPITSLSSTLKVPTESIPHSSGMDKIATRMIFNSPMPTEQKVEDLF
jgi:hypothetical protein